MKIVCIADTHGKHHSSILKIAKGDMIIHAGDVSSVGRHDQVKDFCDWFIKLDFKYKIIVAGNHDFFFQQVADWTINKVLTDYIIYLQDSMVEIEGVKIYGSPWTPTFYNWAFMKDRGPTIAKYWDLIPEGMDIVITHGPPMGILDECRDGHVGCYDLLKRIETVKPKYHIFGHIHEGYGRVKIGKTTFINPSVLDGNYYMVNNPITFNINKNQKYEINYSA